MALSLLHLLVPYTSDTAVYMLLTLWVNNLPNNHKGVWQMSHNVTNCEPLPHTGIKEQSGTGLPLQEFRKFSTQPQAVKQAMCGRLLRLLCLLQVTLVWSLPMLTGTEQPTSK